MLTKAIPANLLWVLMFALSGCVSNRDVAQNNANLSAESGGSSAKTEDAKPANSAVAPNADAANKPKADAPVKEVSAVKETAFAHLKPEHAAALKAWMAQHKGWEPAQEADYPPDLLEYAKADKTRQNYHPYRAIGDFNRDGREDFGVGLVQSKNRKKLAFAVFNAPFNGGKAAFFTGQTQSDDIILYHEGNLYLGADYSDSGYVLEPDGNKYKVKAIFEDEP